MMLIGENRLLALRQKSIRYYVAGVLEEIGIPEALKAVEEYQSRQYAAEESAAPPAPAAKEVSLAVTGMT